MKELIIGINGFLGRNIATLLAQKNTAFDGVFHKNTEKIPKGFTNLYVIDDILAIKNDYDRVYLCSSFIPYNNFDTPSKEFITANIELVNLIANHFWDSKIVFASSVAVYGNNTFTNENGYFANPNLYGLSKIAGESIIKNLPNHAIIRFSSLYGAGMTDKTFLPKIIQQAIQNQKMVIYGNGSRQQDYFHIEDAANLCIKAALATENNIFLGVQGNSISNLQIAKYIQEQLPNVEIEYKGEDNSPSFQYNNDFTKQKLDFVPQKNIKTELIKLFQKLCKV
jgi:UDP-glucose 4-epimerase